MIMDGKGRGEVTSYISKNIYKQYSYSQNVCVDVIIGLCRFESVY